MWRRSTALFLSAALFSITGCALRQPPPAYPSLSPEQHYVILISQAREYLNRKKWDLALDDLKAAAQIKPESATPHNLMGIAFFLRGDYQNSIEPFLRAIELNPAYKEAVNNLGNAYFMTKEYEQAESYLKKALSFDPPPISSYYSLGTLLAIQGRAEESRRYLSKGIELDPEFIDQHDNFITHYSSPSFGAAEFNYFYAKLYASTGRIEKALEFLAKAKRSGFKDWHLMRSDEDFEEVKDDPRIQEYMKDREL